MSNFSLNQQNLIRIRAKSGQLPEQNLSRKRDFTGIAEFTNPSITIIFQGLSRPHFFHRWPLAWMISLAYTEWLTVMIGLRFGLIAVWYIYWADLLSVYLKLRSNSCSFFFCHEIDIFTKERKTIRLLKLSMQLFVILMKHSLTEYKN